MSVVNLETIYREFYDNFQQYAKYCLFIRTKTGAIKPLILNKAQEHIHKCLEMQKRQTGRVRAIILKGRQQGCSTYVSGRFYHTVTHSTGTRVFILAHEAEATSNLFDMASRYHENVPQFLRVSCSKANSKELYFDKLDSGYKVGTAGNKKTGRSSTIQLFHGSEVAFWDNAQDIAGGALQAVPDLPNTEIILESTANGIGNLYHTMAMDALKGDSDYQLIFVPWFWQDEYTKKLPSVGFELTDEEYTYKTTWGLTDEQMYWRRIKIKDLGSDWLFKQEYPANAIEAFQTSGDDSFIMPDTIMAARRAVVGTDYDNPLIIGVDPARFGDDRTSIAWRSGRSCTKIDVYRHKDTMQVADIVALIIQRYNPIMVNVDIGGLGAGVYDRLKQLGYGQIVRGVNFGGSPQDDAKYLNKRAEMWGEMRNWLIEQPAQIPDDDALHADLATPTYDYNHKQQLRLESKDDIKKRGLKSPDMADALALTFAHTYIPTTSHLRQNHKVKFDSVMGR